MSLLQKKSKPKNCRTFVMQDGARCPHHAGGPLVPRVCRHCELVDVRGWESDVGDADGGRVVAPVQLALALEYTKFVNNTKKC